MFRIRKEIFFYAAFAGILIGCGSPKALSNQESVEPEDQVLTYRQSVEFEHLFFEALKARSTGKTEEAFQLFQQCKRINPSDPTVRFELAKIYQSSGDLTQAIEEVNGAIKRDSKNKWMLELKAEILRDLRRYQEEAQVYGKLVEAYPDNVEWKYYEGIALVNAGEYKKAIEKFNQLESEIGIQEDLSLQKEELYIKLGDFEAAVAEIQALIDSNPKEPRYYGMLAELYGANDKFEEAIALFDRLLEIDPENPQALVALSDLYRKSGKPDKAFDFLARAFENPDYPVERKMQILGNYYQLMQSSQVYRKEAVRLLESMIKVHPDNPRVYAIKGDFLKQDKRLVEAAEAYSKSIEMGETEFGVYSQLFSLYLEQENFKALAELTEQAQALYPAKAEVYYYQGVAYLQTEEPNKAIEALESGLMYVVGNPALKGQFYSMLGDLYHGEELHDASDQAYDKALEINPNNAYVLNNYAYYLSLRNQNLEKALDMSGKSNALMPENSSFQDTYAWILFKLKRYEEALTWINKSIENTSSPNAELLEHKGDILFKLGNKEEALEFWNRAFEKDPKREGLAQKIENEKL